MRKTTILAGLAAANFATAALGAPMTEGGKFSISNIAPLIYGIVAAFLFLSRHRAMDRRFVGFLLLFNLSCLASFAIFMLRFQWEPNFIVLAFEDVEILFCVLLWCYGQDNPAQFRTAIKAGILASFPIVVVYALVHLRTIPWFYFGMDDKSQSAVLLCCEAYVLIRFFGGKFDRVVGAGIYILSFLTISRLPVFFFPAILFALMRRSKWAAAFTVIGTAAAVYVVVTFGDIVGQTFEVYDRLSSTSPEHELAKGATTAHLLLLRTAAHIKLSDPWAFFFGIGPDNFSKALNSFPVADDREAIGALDPVLLDGSLQGKAPLHSVPMQMLLDYNVVLFLMFVFYALSAARLLLRRGNLTDILFFSGLFISSTFYSLHNKPYFYLFLTTISLLTLRDTRMIAPSERTLGVNQPPETLPASG
jgi:hypothetical protein